MRVLHVITGLASGGAEAQLDLLLQHTRHDAEVVTLYNFGSVGRRMAGRGVRVYDLGMKSNRQVSRVLRLASLMRRRRYDAVHVHLYRACVYGRVAARLAGIPVIVTTEHSLGETQIEGRSKTLPVRLLYLLTERLSDVTIAVSPKVRDLLVGWGVAERKIRVIPNGLDLERFTFDPEARRLLREGFGIAPDDFVVGSIGRLQALKRYDRLIEAAAPLLSEKEAWLLLVGEGPEKSRLRRLSEAAGASHRVVLSGERDDAPQLLSAMDLFVSPSEEETFGLAALEAATAGLRVLAAECPALDGVHAPNVRRIAEGGARELRSILLDELARFSPGDNPRPASDQGDLRARYDIRSVAARIDALYESLLDRAT